LTAIKYGIENQIVEMSKNATTEETSLAQLVSMIKDTIKEPREFREASGHRSSMTLESCYNQLVLP